MPVVGSKLVFTPIWINVWKIKRVARPAREIFMNFSSSKRANLITLNEIYKNIQINNIEIIDPNSSAITEII